MRLKTRDDGTLHLDNGGSDTITIHCRYAPDGAAKIARAVNLFDALVSALTPFRSNEMGLKLVDMIDTRETGSEEVMKRLNHLVAMIDVILDTIEDYDVNT